MPDENQTKETNAENTTDAFDFRSLVGDDGNFVEGWTEQLPEELRSDLGESKAFANIKNPQHLLKTTISNSKLAGRALLPGKDAKPEEWGKVLEAMPKPKDGEGYGFDPKGITDESVKAFNEKNGYLDKLDKVLTRAGVPTAIAARIAEADAAQLSDMLRANAQDAEQVKAKLTERFGGEQHYETNRIAGRDALSRLYGDAGKEDFDDLVSWLDGLGIADHPRVVGMLTRVAERMSPGKITLGGRTGGASTQQKQSTLASLHGF